MNIMDGSIKLYNNLFSANTGQTSGVITSQVTNSVIIHMQNNTFTYNSAVNGSAVLVSALTDRSVFSLREQPVYQPLNFGTVPF